MLYYISKYLKSNNILFKILLDFYYKKKVLLSYKLYYVDFHKI